MDFDISNMKLLEALDDLLKRKRYDFTQKGISVVSMIDDEVTVAADKLGLVEVLDNLNLFSIQNSNCRLISVNDNEAEYFLFSKHVLKIFKIEI